MNTRHVRLVDSSGTLLAEAQVIDQGDHFGGTVELQATPASIRKLFEEFEEIVNEQMFVFLEEVQKKIEVLPIHVLFDGTTDLPIKDLQIFPSSGEISFRLADRPTRPAITSLATLTHPTLPSGVIPVS